MFTLHKIKFYSTYVGSALSETPFSDNFNNKIYLYCRDIYLYCRDIFISFLPFLISKLDKRPFII